MIDRSSLTLWKSIAPWPDDAQVEQDLILSRALIDIYKDSYLGSELAFRGGTALQKLFYKTATRYSEDLDFVQIHPGPIGGILDKLKEVLDSWLGTPKKKFNEGRVTLYYSFIPTLNSGIGKKKIKIEINTREHYTCLGFRSQNHLIETPWYSGHASVITYHLEELLGTKLRALYQRKKGRDLYDLVCALEQLNINVKKLVECFNFYLEKQNLKISRAEFEENLYQKSSMDSFTKDMLPLLAGNPSELWSFEAGYHLIVNKILTCLPGEPWRGGWPTI